MLTNINKRLGVTLYRHISTFLKNRRSILHQQQCMYGTRGFLSAAMYKAFARLCQEVIFDLTIHKYHSQGRQIIQLFGLIKPMSRIVTL